MLLIDPAYGVNVGDNLIAYGELGKGSFNLTNVKIQPNSVVDQAGDCLNDGGQDAEQDSAGNVRADKLRSEGNEIQM